MRVFVLALLLFIGGCNKSPPSLSPEQVTKGFFSAIYVHRDVTLAMQFVDPSIQEVLKHYHIAASVQRYMLNLSMTDVSVEVDEIDIDFFRKFTNNVTVKVKLTGLKGGEPWIDDRSVRLQKRGNDWIIVELLSEKRPINRR